MFKNENLLGPLYYEEEKEIKNCQIFEINKINKLEPYLVKIETEKNIGSGFFYSFTDNDGNKIPVLVTNNHVIDLDHLKTGKTIKISNDTDEEQEIEIKENTRRFTNKCLDVTMIEIEKDLSNKLLKFDDDTEIEEEKNICIIQHPNGRSASFSDGMITSINGFNIKYNCSTEKGSSGSPILNSGNCDHVLGVHKGTCNFNTGTLIKYANDRFLKTIKKEIVYDFMNVKDIKPNSIFYKKIKLLNGDEYEGELTKDNIKEGYGWCKSADNYIYIGEYKNDKRNGYGTLLRIVDKKNKIEYDGYWKDDHEHGNGKRFLPEGKIEIGEWENGELKKGKTVNPNEEQNDEIKTEGFLKNYWKLISIISVAILLIFSIFLIIYFNSSKNVNTKVLRGECVEYEGEIKDGKKNGDGTCKYDNGDIYKGNWKNNVREGKGILTWANGNIYNGYFKNDTIKGQGLVTLTNGNKYKGEFENDWMDVTYTNGDKYKGKFKKGLLHGNGICTYANGNKYDGEWKDGNIDGYGTYTWSDGDKYNGEWKNDKRDGCGKLIKANGKVDYDGFWENGEKVNWFRNWFHC